MVSHRRRWLPVVLWVAVIYTTIPFVRVLREWYVARWDPVWIGVSVAVVLVTAGAVALMALGRRTGKPQRGNLVWIVGVTAVFVWWTLSLRRSPEEAVHFLEYGVLAVLLHRALRPTTGNDLVYIAAMLIGALTGTVDEIIQWLSPSRVWDWRDLLLNAGAGALAQVMLWRAAPPSKRSWDSRSLRIVLRLAAAQTVLLTLCLANTPVRVARYAPSLPANFHLTSSLNPMAEYGHRYAVPNLGIFTSRLTLEELGEQDSTRATEVGPMLDANRHTYGRFLDTWPIGEDPFTYEVRVHLFARDRNLAKAGEQGFTGALAAEQITIAWCENRLVETLFGNTLDQSSYPWSPELRERLDASHDPDPGFRSAAGSHLITFASERFLRVVLLLLAAVMIMLDLWIGRSQP
jgi:VanZ like family